MTGYIKLHRKIKDSAINKCSPTTRILWIELLLLASWEDGDSARGTIKASVNDLIDALSWEEGGKKKTLSRSQIRTCLDHLKRLEMISADRDGNALIIAINNYDQWQSGNAPKKRATKSSNNKQTNNYDTEHEKFWAEYGSYGVKKASLKAFTAARKAGVPLDVIMDGVSRYKQYITINKTEQKYVKFASNWIRNESWECNYDTTNSKQTTTNKADRQKMAIARALQKQGFTYEQMQAESATINKTDPSDVECPKLLRQRAGGP